MPKDECDPEDPMAIVGVSLPAPSEASFVEMADCFIEEFARMGWSRARILEMFRTPQYVGAYSVWHAKGDDFLRARMDRMPQFFRDAHPARKETAYAASR